MNKFDWNVFIKRISVSAPERIIYEAWATRKGLESWLLAKAEFTKPDNQIREPDSYIQKNDSYVWNWHGYADYVGSGKVLQTNESDYLQFTFTGGCIVDVRVKREAGEVICELIQTMPQKRETDRQYYYIECQKGWTFYLANLKSTLEGGLDLRNKNKDLLNMINS